jgi:hypothetical protein
MEFRETEKEDYIKIKQVAKASFKDVIKEVRTEIKSPLAEKEPLVLLKFSKIGMIEDDYVIEDSEGNRLLINKDFNTNILELLDKEVLKEQAALVSFKHDFNDGNLKVNLLSIITDQNIVRLLY